MALPVEDVGRRLQALAYVIKLYDELTAENGAPTLGTQNQAVDFILAAPKLRRAVAEWAATTNIDEASTAPSRRLPYDEIGKSAPISKRSRTGRLPARPQSNTSAISAEIRASTDSQERTAIARSSRAANVFPRAKQRLVRQTLIGAPTR
jgi:hypothetical protein